MFTIGIVVTRATIDDNAIISANALTDYSYVNARDGMIDSGVQIARCVTGLGPGVSETNSALGGVHFNENRIPFGQCDSSSPIVLPRAAGINKWLGVINVVQCREFSTAAEGIYTSVMINSSMTNETFTFGIYFTGRSKSLNLRVYPIT